MNGQNIQYISLSEAAELTKYSQDYISLLCRQGKLKGVKLGRNWVTTKKWIYDYIGKIREQKEEAVFDKAETENETKSEDINSGGTLSPKFSAIDKNLSFESSNEQILESDKSAEEKPAPTSENRNGKNYFFPFKAITFGGFFVAAIAVCFVFFETPAFSKIGLYDILLEKINFAKIGLFNNSVFEKENRNFVPMADEFSEKGKVNGVENSVGEGGSDNDEKNGLIVIPLEGEGGSEENKKLIEKLSSGFSDDVDIKPNEDGTSGIINPKDNPDEKYLYLMVPVEEEANIQ